MSLRDRCLTRNSSGGEEGSGYGYNEGSSKRKHERTIASLPSCNCNINRTALGSANMYRGFWYQILGTNSASTSAAYQSSRGRHPSLDWLVVGQIVFSRLREHTHQTPYRRHGDFPSFASHRISSVSPFKGLQTPKTEQASSVCLSLLSSRG